MEMTYMTKKEIAPYKKEFYDAMNYVKSSFWDRPYYYRLIGSAKRNLVLRHHNKGFDLDYQIVFYNSLHNLKPSDYTVLKKKFIRLFNDFFVPRGYEHAEDSLSAITVKKIVDGVIHHGFDITLISHEQDGLYIVKYETKDKKTLDLKPMRHSLVYMSKYKDIKGTEMWKMLRDIYKHKKTHNTENKKSFSLLAESVKELFEQHPM